jgi:uncharacterized protein (TIGR02246 family)
VYRIAEEDPMAATHQPPTPDQTSTTTVDAERDIHALLHRLAEHWTRNDAAGYASEFTEDSDYVAFDGTHLRGRAANDAHHARLFASVLQGTRMVMEVESVRIIDPAVAVAHATGSVLFPWQPQVTRRRLSRQTYVLVRRDGRWQIEAFHNTRVRPQRTEGKGFELATRLLRLRAAIGRRRG